MCGKNLSFLLSIIILLVGCNRSSICYRNAVKSLKIKTDYNYDFYTISMENYLIENNYLDDNSINGYLNFFESKNYCRLEIDDIYDKVDFYFADTPSIGGSILECKDVNPYLKFINSDNYIYHPVEETVKMLNEMDDRDLSNNEIKAFIYYTIAILVDTCENG